VDGEVRGEGTLDAMHLRGRLELSEGRIQIRGLGQHLHDIDGQLILEDDEAVFPEDRPVRARDAGGEATLFGRVRFEGLMPREASLTLRADGFPIRREGAIVASLTGQALLGGAITERQTTSRLRTRDFEVRLPEQGLGSLQGLDPHTEVHVVGDERRAGGSATEAYALEVDIDASQPFDVIRSDFTARVRAQLHATYQDPALRVRGQAEILRGTFEIFGKRFELSQGSLMFNPDSTDLDPRVNVTAVYEIPGRSGATVTVRVDGPLSDLHVEFTSTETNDRGEIIALLLTGGRRDSGDAVRDATQQAANFISGVVAGILTLGLREEFGDVIPVLAIESQGLGGTRIRVGRPVNELIPDFLRDIVTGAYVEGFLVAAAQGQGGASGGVGGGATLELTFPYNILFRGTYVPVDNGSMDVFYEP
ncbi:MAG: translocation/assembly module TamB, partial [Sandaracinaceae bacterium]|nr:translocation/assembly module TamB [Sandaracinaceae bacterium]